MPITPEMVAELRGQAPSDFSPLNLLDQWQYGTPGYHLSARVLDMADLIAAQAAELEAYRGREVQLWEMVDRWRTQASHWCVASDLEMCSADVVIILNAEAGS
ncbi:hypothetical protein [Deinococcus sp.]|uniref:hypothetical protein n=1 Tax=Deinococcus sp. TaxID=47478 RepID=UPI0025DCAE4F|nr:hypothetical protein [Deinococcus sp.]